MESHDSFQVWSTSPNPRTSSPPHVELIRPEMVVDLTVSWPIYNMLESNCRDPAGTPYEDLSLTNIQGVQFINPWNLQYDNDSSESVIPFFLTVTDSNESAACFLRYDVRQSREMGGQVHRPILKQLITLPTDSTFDIVSPTVLGDDCGSMWGTEEGLLYAPDVSQDPVMNFRGPVKYRGLTGEEVEKRFVVPSRMIVRDNSGIMMRHRVGFDAISGKKFKVLRNTIVISEYTAYSRYVA